MELCNPTTGRMPESGKECSHDTAALQLLGVTPELGAEVTVSFHSITDKDQTAFNNQIPLRWWAIGL